MDLNMVSIWLNHNPERNIGRSHQGGGIVDE